MGDNLVILMEGNWYKVPCEWCAASTNFRRLLLKFVAFFEVSVFDKNSQTAVVLRSLWDPKGCARIISHPFAASATASQRGSNLKQVGASRNIDADEPGNIWRAVGLSRRCQ